MKKALLLVTLMMMASGLISGCTLDDVLNLGGDCPNVEYIQMPDNASCSPQNISSTECKRHIEDGAFDAQRCPVGYVCNQNNEKAYCHCEVPCGISCCPQNSQCDLYTHQCIPANQAACSSDAQCSIMDVTLPYCDTKTGQCVACTKDEHCKDEMSCQNNVCIECTHDDQCKDKQICSPEGRCVECLGDEPPACDPNQTNHVMICIQGKLTPKPCPADAPVCSNGECIACQKHEDCQFDGHTGYCIDNQCLECLDDSECLEYYGSHENPKLYCLDNQCSTCQTNAQCSDPTPACNAVLGACTQCSETTPGNKCENNKFTSCDVQKGKLIEKQCDNACDIEKGCVDCTENSDCTRPNKICTSEQKCIECETDDHCADHPQNRPYCNTETGMCYECESDEQCQNSPNGNFCHTEQKVCVQCKENAHCTEHNARTCSLDYKCVNACTSDEQCDENSRCYNGSCVIKPTDGSCFDSKDCTSATPICSTAGKCVQCTTDTECTSKNLGNACVQNECKQCSNDNHCSGNTPKCNTNSNVCVPCFNDANKCSDDQTQVLKCIDNQWVPSSCDDAGCSNGTCNQCIENTFECNSKKLNKCVNHSWQLYTTCDYGCDEDHCIECDPNTVECNGNTLVTCDANGKKTSKNCSNYCHNAKCVDCIPGSPNYCSDNYTLIQCLNGTIKYKNCDYGCKNNECDTFKCNSGSYQCKNGNSYICKNNDWSLNTSCDYECNSSTGLCSKKTYHSIRVNATSSSTPDIDAVVIAKAGRSYESCSFGSTCFAATNVSISGDLKTGVNNNMLNQPNSFVNWPYNNSPYSNTCYYRSGSNNGSLTFGSLSAGSSATFTFNTTIEAGDVVYVFELSGCAMQYANDESGNQAQPDAFYIYAVNSSGASQIKYSSIGGVVEANID